jgi:hypothetical protein
MMFDLLEGLINYNTEKMSRELRMSTFYQLAKNRVFAQVEHLHHNFRDHEILSSHYTILCRKS